MRVARLLPYVFVIAAIVVGLAHAAPSIDAQNEATAWVAANVTARTTPAELALGIAQIIDDTHLKWEALGRSVRDREIRDAIGRGLHNKTQRDTMMSERDTARDERDQCQGEQ